jgi:HemY protein
MWRLVFFLAAVLAAAWGLSLLADSPGTLSIDWEGYKVDTSVFHAVIILAAVTGVILFVWALLRQILTSPATMNRFLVKRRQRRGLDAISSGMIATGAGDRSTATRYAIQARKTLPNEPLTHLLRAQAAQLAGDRATARRIYESMLSAPDTEQLGLRGLFLEASEVGEPEAARQFAERALKLNSKLDWPALALFDAQCKASDWAGALDTLAIATRNGQIDKTLANRRRAVLLTAQALTLEDSDPEKSLNLAMDAHGIAPSLVPAAAVAGRLLASRGHTARAARVLQKTWAVAPHPDLAAAYAYARPGDSTQDRMGRIRQLSSVNPDSIETPIAIAATAVDARFYDEAREALKPLLGERLTRRVARLMARIEGEQHGDKGGVREWLMRSGAAAPDPVWIADGVISAHWAPVSPVTGALDAYEWRVPVTDMISADGTDDELIGKWTSGAKDLDLEDTARSHDRLPSPSAHLTSGDDSAGTLSAVAVAGKQLARSLEQARRSKDGQRTSNSDAAGKNGTADADMTRPRAPDDPGSDFDQEFEDGFVEPRSQRKTAEK